MDDLNLILILINYRVIKSLFPEEDIQQIFDEFHILLMSLYF